MTLCTEYGCAQDIVHAAASDVEAQAAILYYLLEGSPIVLR
jgi:hypothetical protein